MAALTLDNGTTVNNATGAITVDGTLILDDTSSITSGTVTVDNGGILTLNDSSGLSDGVLKISGTLNADGTDTLNETVTSGLGNALDNETVTGPAPSRCWLAAR